MRKADSHSKPVVWIGLVHAKPTPSCEIFDDNEVGGYTNVLALARDRFDFQTQVVEMLKNYELSMVTLESVEPLDDRLKRWTVDDELLRLAGEVRRHKTVRHNVWEAYLEDSGD